MTNATVTQMQQLQTKLTGQKPDIEHMTREQLIQLALNQEAALSAASAPKALSLKVSEKGALSIYGLGRFPVTLYRGQIERLLAHAPQINAFIKANDTLLAVKA